LPGPCESNTDNEVNVSELLLVLEDWDKNCITGGSANAGSITSIQDCMDAATNEAELEPHSEEWNNWVNKCVEGLCEAQIIVCD
jgi:hypothetical protein